MYNNHGCTYSSAKYPDAQIRAAAWDTIILKAANFKKSNTVIVSSYYQCRKKKGNEASNDIDAHEGYLQVSILGIWEVILTTSNSECMVFVLTVEPAERLPLLSTVTPSHLVVRILYAGRRPASGLYSDFTLAQQPPSSGRVQSE